MCGTVCGKISRNSSNLRLFAVGRWATICMDKTWTILLSWQSLCSGRFLRTIDFHVNFALSLWKPNDHLMLVFLGGRGRCFRGVPKYKVGRLSDQFFVLFMAVSDCSVPRSSRATFHMLNSSSESRWPSCNPIQVEFPLMDPWFLTTNRCWRPAPSKQLCNIFLLCCVGHYKWVSRASCGFVVQVLRLYVGYAAV